MKISLVTNRTLREDNERLRLENRALDEKNSILVAEKTALSNRNHNLKVVVDELLKDKVILSDKLCAIYTSERKVSYETKQANL